MVTFNKNYARTWGKSIIFNKNELKILMIRDTSKKHAGTKYPYVPAMSS